MLNPYVFFLIVQPLIHINNTKSTIKLLRSKLIKPSSLTYRNSLYYADACKYLLILIFKAINASEVKTIASIIKAYTWYLMSENEAL